MGDRQHPTRRGLPVRRMALGASAAAVMLGGLGGMSASASVRHHGGDRRQGADRHQGGNHARPHRRAADRRDVSGSVSGSSASGFTISRGAATIAVTVSSTTRYVERGVPNAGLTNVQLGDRVEVRGTAVTGGGIAASVVAIQAPEQQRVSGTVAVLSASGFTLARGVAQIAVSVSSTTTYSETGVTAPTFKNVLQGDTVKVTGTVNSHVLDATSITITVPHISAVVGSVGTAGVTTAPGTSSPGTSSPGTATTGSSFVLERRHGRPMTVQLSATTSYLETGATPTVASVTPGTMVVAIGSRKDGTLDATTVVILTPAP